MSNTVIVALIKRTALVSTELSLSEKGNKDADTLHCTNSLIWAQNKRGYTPMQIAWMRCVRERSNNVTTQRAGMTQHAYPPMILRSGVYQKLLHAATEEFHQMMHRPHIKRGDGGLGIPDMVKCARELFGSFWARLMTILASTNPADKPRSLHVVAAFPSTGPGPYVPKCIFKMILVMFSDQVMERDKFGRVPLHYASAVPPFQRETLHKLSCVDDATDNGSASPLGWACFGDARGNERLCMVFGDNVHEGTSEGEAQSNIEMLLRTNPGTASIRDRDGQLPLHFAIESEKRWRAITISQGEVYYWSSIRRKTCADWGANVKRIAVAHPMALDEHNPKNGLNPFMQAAVGSSASINTIYELLRMSPAQVLHKIILV